MNSDGNRDLLVGSYTGHNYIFYGTNNGDLGDPELINDKDGNFIHQGKYFNFKTCKYIVEDKTDECDQSNFVKAVDWDNDGDLDLLISGSKGIKLWKNEGTGKKPSFAISGKKVLDKYNVDAIVDWDGDGLWDIIAGCKQGGVYFYKNIGKIGVPKFEEPVSLFKCSDFVDENTEAKGGICQVAVADYNNDGKLDLIIGTNITPDPSEYLIGEELKEFKKAEKEFKNIRNKITVYSKKHFIGKYKTREEMWKAREKDAEYMKLSKEYDMLSKLYYKNSPYKHSKGLVYVSLRK